MDWICRNKVAAKKNEAVAKMGQLLSAAAPMNAILENAEAMKYLESAKPLKESTASSRLAHLVEHHGVTEDSVKALYALAKYQYECGNYADANPRLTLCYDVATDQEMIWNLLWGKLATSILMEDWSEALKDFSAIDAKLVMSKDSASTTAPSIQQRTWLLHWSLPIFFNSPEARLTLLDFYQNERTSQIIQLSCPYLLRYMIVAPIVSKRRFPKEIIKLVDQESYQYSDPVTKFIETLYGQMDFELAETQLSLCSKMFDADPLLQSVKDDFLNNGRQLIFELYCKLHSCVDTRLLASKKPEKFDDSEKWIGELIRGAKLDAKIDTQANQVLIGAQSLPLYQQLIDRTKPLNRPLGPVSGGSGSNANKKPYHNQSNRDGGRSDRHHHSSHHSSSHHTNSSAHSSSHASSSAPSVAAGAE